MNITYVVAMQTSIQKKCFFQWDNTMVMDWTHVSSGSLVVTTATGRGINVIDFLALDQKSVTMENIVEFFKRKTRLGGRFRRSSSIKICGMAGVE
ncbi:hypothetical protein AM588_10000534 [Phytophthora nicotianae]|uniref:ZSWIM1/3 RNaseH-like domain-containing protein n=1 Tax=Phytophthora nicotianae TaxID=4792 RepID=A0A0W8C4F3_PHYNI|nr:hypothetical protein AM588_10000534 [Phytophthora nicotianae]